MTNTNPGLTLKPTDIYSYLTLEQWLQDKAIVFTGYYDDAKAVNLESLLVLWVRLAKQFSTTHPYASDYFQVKVIEKDNPLLKRAYTNVLWGTLEEFRNCPHLKVWREGKLIDSEEVRNMLGTIEWGRMANDYKPF